MKHLGLRLLFFGLFCLSASFAFGQTDKPMKTKAYDFVKKANKGKKFIYGVSVKSNPVPSKFDYQIIDSTGIMTSPLDIVVDNEQLRALGEKLGTKNAFVFDFEFDMNPEKFQLVIVEYLGMRYDARLKFKLAGKEYFHPKSLRIFKNSGITGAHDPLINQCRMSGETLVSCKDFVDRGRTDFGYCVEQRKGEVDLKIDIPGRRFSLPDKFFLEVGVYIHTEGMPDSIRVSGPPTMAINRIEFLCGGKECERSPITMTIPLTYIKGRYYTIHVDWFEEKSKGNRTAVVRRYGTMHLPNRYSFAVGDTKGRSYFDFVLPWKGKCTHEDDAKLSGVSGE